MGAEIPQAPWGKGVPGGWLARCWASPAGWRGGPIFHMAPMWHLAHGSDELKGPVAKTLEKQTKDQLTRPSPPATHLGKQQV